jgi:hypothetical protein
MDRNEIRELIFEEIQDRLRVDIQRRWDEVVVKLYWRIDPVWTPEGYKTEVPIAESNYYI